MGNVKVKAGSGVRLSILGASGTTAPP